MSYSIFLLFILVSCFNFAHAAQIRVPNFHEINNQIYRGGRPTFQGLQDLKKAGIKSVINLENMASAVGKERAMAKQMGLGFMSSPMSWMKPPSDQQIDKILAVISNPKNQPVYIHCLHGRDRTGVVSALYRVLIEGVSPGRAYSEMKKLGFRSFFVTLEYYFRERTGYWDLRSNEDSVRPQDRPENRNFEMEGEIHDDNDVFSADPYDLTS